MLPVVLAGAVLDRRGDPRSGDAAQRAFAPAVAIASQAAACVLAMSPLVGVLQTGAALEGSWSWSYPVEIIALRVDALARSSSSGRCR